MGIDLKQSIREVLLNVWDPIGVGPYERASSIGTLDEYDAVVNRLVLSFGCDVETVSAILRSFESEIGLQDVADARRRELAAVDIRRLYRLR